MQLYLQFLGDTNAISDVSVSLFEIRYDYDTIITKNRDYRYDFDFS